jgi:hypothetical protein
MRNPVGDIGVGDRIGEGRHTEPVGNSTFRVKFGD